MKCPACLHQFTVRRGGFQLDSSRCQAAATAGRPRRQAAGSGRLSSRPSTTTKGRRRCPTPRRAWSRRIRTSIDLPAPKEHFAPDLPTPKSSGSHRIAIAPPKPPLAVVPPPAPPPMPPLASVQRRRRCPSSRSTRATRAISIRRDAGPGPDDIDLPAPSIALPRARHRRSAGAALRQQGRAAIALSRTKRRSVGAAEPPAAGGHLARCARSR